MSQNHTQKYILPHLPITEWKVQVNVTTTKIKQQSILHVMVILDVEPSIFDLPGIQRTAVKV